MGSWITYGLGTENDNLPAFITICPTLAHGGVNNWGAAFLPAWCQGTPIGNAAVPSDQAMVKHIRNTQLSASLQRQQLDLLAQMNHEHLELTGPNQALEGRINSFELAFRMQMAMPDAQDVDNETEVTKKLYGMDNPVTSNFGRQCLMARRFIERGVRFVQVTHSDSEVQWDQHGNLYKGHSKNAAEVDKPIAGLLKDLRSRGLLQDTLVIWGASSAAPPPPKAPMAATTTPKASPCGSPAAASKLAPLTVPPMTTATSPRRTRFTSTTSMPPSSPSWAWITRSSPTATPAVTSASRTCSAMW